MLIAGLDFETANSRTSICQAGVALVEDGNTVERREWLLRPHRSNCWFSSFCTDIHGITFEDVRYAPEFPEIWQEMYGLLSTADIVVAHNAVFDMGQLKKTLALYEEQPVTFKYACSYRISRHLLPELPRHTLNVVAEYFGHSFCHHDALEDAEACAVIAYRTGIPENFIKTFTYPEESGSGYTHSEITC